MTTENVQEQTIAQCELGELGEQNITDQEMFNRLSKVMGSKEARQYMYQEGLFDFEY